MTKTNDAKAKVVGQIISRLEEAQRDGLELPWRKSWKGSSYDIRNAKTANAFSGGNWMVFWITGMIEEYDSSYWATYNQWKHLGENISKKTITDKKGKEREVTVSDAHVRKGESSTYGLVPMFGKTKTVNAAGEEVEEEFVYFRAFSYFNLSQVDGVDVSKLPNRQLEDFQPIEAAEKILNAIENIDLRHGEGNSAFYKPVRKAHEKLAPDTYDDYIMMPSKESFDSEAFYYAVRFHETIHWTGHEDRLDRKGANEVKPFGVEDYTKEELIAEFGAAMLCAQTGIENITLDNSTGYIAGWLEKINEDSGILLEAASEAQKAVDYILNFSQEEES